MLSSNESVAGPRSSHPNKEDCRRFGPAQCRGARGLLGWSKSDLSEASQTPRKLLPTLNAERGILTRVRFQDIQGAFEDAGIDSSMKMVKNQTFAFGSDGIRTDRHNLSL